VRLCGAQIIFVDWVNLGWRNFIIPNLLCFLLILSSFTWNSNFFFFSFIFLPLLGFRFGCKGYTLFLNLVNRQYRININFLNYPFALRPKRTFARSNSFEVPVLIYS
jgi:hypothetical protein